MDKKTKTMIWEGLAIAIAAVAAWILQGQEQRPSRRRPPARGPRPG